MRGLGIGKKDLNSKRNSNCTEEGVSAVSRSFGSRSAPKSDLTGNLAIGTQKASAPITGQFIDGVFHTTE